MDSSRAAAETVFQGVKAQISAPRPFNELTIRELLRETYPKYHVTCTSTAACDLFGFAKAGHANLTVEETDDLYDATRSYYAGVGMRDHASAQLLDLVRFGKLLYNWQGKNFIVYEVKWMENWGRATHVYFILTQLGGNELLRTRNHIDTDALLHAVGEWSTELHDEIYVFDNGFWGKSKELWASVESCSWDDVILNQTTKDNLIADVQGFFGNESLYQTLCVPWKRGVILHGVPGNGKTISIKALISALWTRPDPIPSLYVKSFDGCNGRGAQKSSIHSIFSHARVMAPCLLIFEDLDSLITDETRSYFLNEVDGLESNDGILMIGSTNHLDSLDPAISKRPSRFDRKYHFRLPDEVERKVYCEYWRKKIGAANEIVSFNDGVSDVVAKWTEGFSFAYLKELFVVSLLAIARGQSGAGAIGDQDEVKHDEEDNEDIDETRQPSSDDGENTTPTSEPVIVKHEDAVAPGSGTEIATSKNTPSPAGSNSKPKRSIPNVPILEHLKTDLLLKTIKAQLRTLLEEMDNTPEGEWPSERKKTGKGTVVTRTINPTMAYRVTSAKNVNMRGGLLGMEEAC